MNLAYVTLVGAILAAAAMAQENEERIRVFNKSVAVAAPAAGADVLTLAPQTLGFVSSEFSFEEKLVKGAPYSADAVTETTQMLVDGNRISRKNVAQVFRDSQGRTRREQSIDSVGPWASAAPHKTIFINDPVARVNYILDPEARTARKIALPKDIPAGGGDVFFFHREVATTASATGGAPLPSVMPLESGVAIAGVAARSAAADSRNLRQESLGKQTIEGVLAEGTRTIVTIPAGEIGNDRPIETVSERWYSPELQTVVMTKRSDPRFGDTVYKLTGIRRDEPARSLFEVPAEYTVKEGGDIELKRKMERKFTEEIIQQKKRQE